MFICICIHNHYHYEYNYKHEAIAKDNNNSKHLRVVLFIKSFLHVRFYGCICVFTCFSLSLSLCILLVHVPQRIFILNAIDFCLFLFTDLTIRYFFFLFVAVVVQFLIASTFSEYDYSYDGVNKMCNTPVHIQKILEIHVRTFSFYLFTFLHCLLSRNMVARGFSCQLLFIVVVK